MKSCKRFLRVLLGNPVWTGIGAIATVLALIVTLLSLSGSEPALPAIEGRPTIPTVTIRIDETNKIHRTTIQNEGDWKLAWVIQRDGEQVLVRNALSETTYRYFRNDPGVYTVYVRGWIGDRYQAISNIESYEIR